MRRVFYQAQVLAMKDVRVLLTDRAALFFMFLLPLVFVAGFALANPNFTPEDERMRFLLTTQEAPGGISHDVIGQLTAGDDAAFRTMPYEDALRAVESEEEPGFVAFPANFTEALTNGRRTALEVVSNVDAPNAQAGLEGVARAIAGQLSTVSTASRILVELRLQEGRTPEPGELEALQQQPRLVTFDTERVGDIRRVEAANFTLTGYLTMFIFFVAALSAEGIAKERKNHTLERLLANGVRRESIVLGKYTGTVYLGLVQAAVLWTAGVLIFGVEMGNAPWAVIVLTVLMVFASAAIGMVLASIARSQQSASTLAVLVSLISAPIGGSWWPLFIVPPWMQALARLTPHGWANTAFNKLLLFGADGSDVLVEMGALVVFGVIFLTIAFARFRAAPGATA